MQIWQILPSKFALFSVHFCWFDQMHTLQLIVFYICNNSMQFWQCSTSLQFLLIITAKDFAFRSLQNLQLSTSAYCSFSLQWFIAVVHCNSKCIAVIPLQFHCNFPAIVCSVSLKDTSSLAPLVRIQNSICFDVGRRY